MAEAIRLKGTRQGLLVSVQEDVAFSEALEALALRFEASPAFFAGGALTVDFGWREISEAEFALLEAMLGERNLRLLGIVSTSLNTRSRAEARGHRTIIGRLGLAEHQGRAARQQAVRRSAPARAVAPPEEKEEASEAQGEPTHFVRRTVRSGQRVTFPGNLVVMGDVNPGAVLEAYGDVIVLGSLRGLAHAGAGGSDSASVVALDLRTSQVRIGRQLWLAEEDPRSRKLSGPVRLRVAGGQVVVEPYGS